MRMTLKELWPQKIEVKRRGKAVKVVVVGIE
jgi:hypothetical protein